MGALVRWHAPPKGGVGQETPPSALSVDDLPGRTDVVCLSRSCRLQRANPDDRAEPASDELSGDDASRSAAGVSFPFAAVEVLKPFQQLVTPTSPASTAQQAMARIAQDAADISWAIESSPAAQLAEGVEKQRRKFAEIGADAARAVAGVGDWVAGWKRLIEQHSVWAQQVAGAVQRAVDGLVPWIKKAATKVGEEAKAYYRRAAPPNWITDEVMRVDFIAAVRSSATTAIRRRSTGSRLSPSRPTGPERWRSCGGSVWCAKLRRSCQWSRQ